MDWLYKSMPMCERWSGVAVAWLAVSLRMGVTVGAVGVLGASTERGECVGDVRAMRERGNQPP